MIDSLATERQAFPVAPIDSPFRVRDVMILLGVCAALYAPQLFFNRTLSTHETIHTQNIREMLSDGDFVIPHYGGRAWLERPPLPHWLTAIPVAIGQAVGLQSDWLYRVSSLLAATAIVVMIGWLSSLFWGRRSGLFAGAILATMREFFNYAIAPECDIFLATIIAGALVCFAKAEIGQLTCEKWSLAGKRSWFVLGFFTLWGLTNLAKGLFFGTVLVAVPVGLFVLWQRSFSPWRRWVWLWGIIAFCIAGCSWAVTAYLKRPDVTELWSSDYMGRLSQGYMKESPVYYFIHLPWILFPWTIAAIAGLVQSVHVMKANRGSFETFLVCWAIGDLLILSVPQGKHHHYYLHAMAPWAVMSVTGFRWLWQKIMPWQSDVAYRNGMIASIAIGIVGHFASQSFEKWVMNSYRYDREFAARVSDRIQAGQSIVVLNDSHPLDASWMLFYLPEKTPLLHNSTYLLDESLYSSGDRVLTIVAKGFHEELMAKYGTFERLDVSEKSRGRRAGPECWGLYRFHLKGDIMTVQFKPLISVAQSAGRTPGPFLK